MMERFRHLRASLAESARTGKATLPGLLRQRAKECGDRLALREKDRGIWHCYNWAHFYRQVCALAMYLRQHGLGKGGAVVIVGGGSPGWFSADWGTQALGVLAGGV